jgi:hypothetical protein
MATDDLKGRLADFQPSSDSPRHQPDPYVLKGLDRMVETFMNEAAYLRFPEDFIETMTDNFVEAFRRLDAFGRDDPFWDGTNRRPTQYKLYSACEIALRANPIDCEALLLKAAVQTVFGSSFDPKLWERLALACLADPTWIVYSALYAECYGSYDTVPDLVSLLKRMNSCDGVAAPLKAMIAGGLDQPGRVILSREHSANWANRVLDICGISN